MIQNCVILFLLASLSHVSPVPLSPGELVKGGAKTLDNALHPVEYGRTVARSAADFLKFPDKSKGPQRGYTWAEVAQYDGEVGRPLLIVVNNNVYDVTDFSNSHPAGPELIKKHAGQDATEAVRLSGMPQQVTDVFFKRFLVGWIEK